MNKYIIAIALLLAVGLSFGAERVKATASQLWTVNSATATTTVSYMTPGTGTTTIPLYNLSQYQFNDSTDQGQLNLQLTGSSTAATYDVAFQSSMDAVDWYDVPAIPTAIAVSQANILLSSTTQKLRFQANNTLSSTTLISVPVPNILGKYKRALVSIPTGVGSTNGAVWSQAVNKLLPVY